MNKDYSSVSGLNSASKNLQTDRDLDFITGNYPPSNDSTASGGYGSSANIWSDKAQRGHPEQGSNTGLIDQSLNGGPLNREIQDAKQGQDASSREKFQHEATRDFGRGGAGAMKDTTVVTLSESQSEEEDHAKSM